MITPLEMPEEEEHFLLPGNKRAAELVCFNVCAFAYIELAHYFRAFFFIVQLVLRRSASLTAYACLMNGRSEKRKQCGLVFLMLFCSRAVRPPEILPLLPSGRRNTTTLLQVNNIYIYISLSLYTCSHRSGQNKSILKLRSQQKRDRLRLFTSLTIISAINHGRTNH